MAQHPWHPRVVPFIAYVAWIPLFGWAMESAPWLVPVFNIVRSVLVVALLWRYRKLLPELNWKFHWLAAPVAVLVVAVWVWLGIWMEKTFPAKFGGEKPVNFFERMGPALGWTTMILRLLVMSIVVPMVEELFIRSLMLRSLHSLRLTAIGMVQFAIDMPLIGDWLGETKLGERAAAHPPVFGPQFTATPLGRLSLFGVAASTVVFTLSHAQRDWPGAVFCGVAYCLLLAVTARKGLGPVIWAHGLTNALLWGYTLYFNDWRFL